MAASAGFRGWRDRHQPQWCLKLLENLRCPLTRIDVLVGFCATMGISTILMGFRYPIISEYEAGWIADLDVRATQNVTYENRAATNLKGAKAEAGVPVLYQVDSDLIAESIVSARLLDECDRTLRDIQLVKGSFLNILIGIFHHRMDYPGYDFKRTDDESKSPVDQDPGPKQTETI
jgi:membrane-associated HD superfamily phosphohydrolase